MQTLQEKNCPLCAEPIKVEAIKCKHCGSMLGSTWATAEDPGKPRTVEALVFIALISVPFLIGGLLLAWFYSLPPAEQARIERSAQ